MIRHPRIGLRVTVELQHGKGTFTARITGYDRDHNNKTTEIEVRPVVEIESPHWGLVYTVPNDANITRIERIVK